jgi:hypothetical protein
MNEPIVQTTGELTTYRFIEEDVVVEVSMLKEITAGYPSAEFLIMDTSRDMIRTLAPVRRIGLVTENLNAWADDLGDRVIPPRSDGFWITALGFIQQETIRKHREGSPFVHMGNFVPDLESNRYLIEPFIYANKISLLYGKGGSLKSWIALYLSVLCDLYAQDNEAGFLPAPSKVLWLSYEEDQQTVHERIQAIHKGLKYEADSAINFRFMTRPLVDDVSVLKQFCDEEDIGLIVIDSAIPASGGEASDSGAADRFFKGLQQLKGGKLVLAHEAKNSTVNNPFGSVVFTNMPRSVWEIQSEADYDSSYAAVSLVHRKVNTGRRRKPIGLRFDFSPSDPPEWIRVRNYDLLSDPNLRHTISPRERIYQALSRHGTAMDLDLIVEETGLKNKEAEEVLKNKPFQYVGNGIYALETL